MTIQEDVAAARKLPSVSRKTLATLSGLTESVIWRIETKGTTKGDEVARLQPILDDVLGRSLRARAGIEPGRRDAGHPDSDLRRRLDDGPTGTLPRSASAGRDAETAPVGAAAGPPTAAVAVLDSPAEPPPAETLVVDWSTLVGVAAGVSEHDLERGLLTGPRQLEGVRLVSNSELQAFKDCRRRWWLGWYRGMRLRFESPTGALAIGDRIHRALKLHYAPNGLARVDPRTALERLIAEDWTRLVTALEDDPARLVSVGKKFGDEANLERAMIDGYVQWLTETGADSEFDVVSSEQYVEVDITHMLEDAATLANVRQIKLIGKLDVRVKRRRDGVRLFIDHKSLAEFTTARQILPLDEQMLHYLLLEWLGTQEGEERCDGALYNMLRKVKRTNAAKPPFYDRVEVRHNPIELENFRRRVVAETLDILEVQSALDEGTSHQDIAYPRPTRDCRWKCAFFAVCPMFDDGSRAEDMLTQWFVRGDPLDYYRTGLNESEMTE
jgi:PD-(D/E)XK nuclease superfamily protein